MFKLQNQIFIIIFYFTLINCVYLCLLTDLRIVVLRQLKYLKKLKKIKT